MTDRPLLHLVGYWQNAEHPEYPDPHELVDEAWDADERWAVASYLLSGTFLRGMMGLSPCRICGRPNGASEFTDGVLVWPEGLVHYVEDHAVRLPRAVEAHVLAAGDRLGSATVSTAWWVAGAPAPLPDRAGPTTAATTTDAP